MLGSFPNFLGSRFLGARLIMEFKIRFATALLCVAVLSSCGGGNDGGLGQQQAQTRTEHEVYVVGAVQKGPFVIGSPVIVNLLSPDALNTDSRVVTNTVDNLGRFNFSLDEGSTLIELSATGYYRNEITGELSQGTVTLRSVIGLSGQEEQTSYINLLTHLTSQRIRNLIKESDLQFEDAKNQAENEFLIGFSEVVPNYTENDFASLSIYDDELSSGSAYLLTVSSILYRYALEQSIANSTNPDAELTLLLNALQADFGEDGVIDDSPLLESLRLIIPEINPSIVSNNVNDWINGIAGFEAVDINQYLDTDLDGVFNSIDNDDDNDGVADELDASPYDKSFIVANQAIEAYEDQLVEIDIETNNPMDAEISVEIISSASNGTVSGSYPNLKYTPNTNFEGIDSFSYQLTQEEISSDIATVSLNIVGVNDAPSIQGTPITDFMAHNVYSFVPMISDIENDSLALSIQNLPNWASFDDQTGEISGFPSNDDIGLYENILLSVSDGNLTTNFPTFNIEVRVNPYELGFLVENQELEIYEDSSINIDISSNNPLGMDTDITNLQRPDHGSVQGIYPEITYTPNENFNGIDSFKYRLSQDIIVSGEVTITVNTLPVNDAPTISGAPDNSITAFTAFSFVPTSSDVDEDELEYSVTNLPSWASFNRMTGEISGNPDNEDVGVFQEILISVTDGEASTALEPFQLEVIGNPWYTLPSFGVGRHSPAAATIGDQIFLTGGYGGGVNTYTSLDVFNFDTNTWDSKAAFLNGRRSHTAHAVNEYVYVVGGELWPSALTSIERYDVSSNSWAELEPMSTGRSAHAGCVFNDDIYVFGGFTSPSHTDSTDTVEMYDPETNNWESKTPMPISNWGLSCAVVGDEIYVFGGANNTNGYLIYDPVLDSWGENVSLNFPRRYGFAAQTLGTDIYLVGGYNDASDRIDVLDTKTGEWSTKTRLITPRYDMAHTVFEGKIILLGGRNGSSNGLASVEEYDPIFDE